MHMSCDGGDLNDASKINPENALEKLQDQTATSSKIVGDTIKKYLTKKSINFVKPNS